MADTLSAWAPDLGVVAAYGKLIPEDLLRLPRLGMINVHASLLPKYRGAAPVHRAVIDGERETGVTIMRMVAALDAGAMLAKVDAADRPRRNERRGRTRPRYARRPAAVDRSSTNSPPDRCATNLRTSRCPLMRRD